MTRDSTVAVELRGIRKQFGPVRANAWVDLHVKAGTIHGVIGENGAGKTTAMNILSGLIRADAGRILVRGQEREWNSSSEAIASGIGMVHQHFMLAGPCSALDNVIVGAEPLRWGIIERKKARAKLETLATQYGLPVNWETSVAELPVGAQQRVEILKLLYRKAEILIFDEPTSVLTPQETKGLFENLIKLRAEGKTVLLVTHKLNEIMSVTDRVSVFRDGKVITECVTHQTSAQELANLMVGRKVSLRANVAAAKAREDLAIEVSGLIVPGDGSGRHKVADVSFQVRRGEIVGIAGVEGNGQSELLQALLHPKARSSGTIRILSQDVSHWSAPRLRELGIAFIPEDRQQEGLLLERSILENFLLGLHRSAEFSRGGFILATKVEKAAVSAMEEYDVRPRELSAAAATLSGGNQQKLIIAREFYRDPKVIIAAQPTRGVDVGAIEFIHQRLVQARDGGAGVLLISSDLDEILALSDRILVMFEGRIAGEFERGQVSERELGLRMGGAVN
jgi:simple sugar transport system ATP-binding protein